MSGLDRHGRRRLRFLTLGMSPNSKQDDINKCFIKLRKSIVENLSVNYLIEKGYITKKQALYYYGDGIDWNKRFPFEYLKVFTSEGAKGVLHVLFFGRYIPQNWLYERWTDIIGDKNLFERSVWIKQCKRNIYDKKGLGKYCVNQYVAGQSEYIKFNNSANWCFRGYLGKYKEAKRVWRWHIEIGLFDFAFIHFWHNTEYDNFYEQLTLGEAISRVYDGSDFVWMD